MLNDPVTARYTHTLVLDKRQGGEYECIVSTLDDHTMAAPLNDSAILNIQGIHCCFLSQHFLMNFYLVATPPINVEAFQKGPTTVHVFWDPPEPLWKTVGYTVHYTGASSCGSVSVAGGESSNVAITGLVNGQLYQFSVAGVSLHFDSDSVPADPNPIALCKYA